MKTQILGIVNVTPDSFFDGSIDALSVENAVAKALRLRDEGADIIDIGGESTRPGFEPVTVEEELTRVLPVIRALRIADPSLTISIDTRTPQVVRAALEAGVEVLNLHGGLNFEMIKAIQSDRPKQVIVYHVEDVREQSVESAIRTIETFFEEQRRIAICYGLCSTKDVDEVILLDPGIGFGKTLEQTREILRRGPRVIDVSRKSHLGHILKQQLVLENLPGTKDRLEAGLAETAFAILCQQKSCSPRTMYVRTHDVLATKRFLAVLEWIANPSYGDSYAMYTDHDSCSQSVGQSSCGSGHD